MSATTNLGLGHIDTNQSQKEVTHNEALDDLDAALCDSSDIEVTDGTNSLTAAQVRAAQHLELVEGSPATSAAFTVELAAIKRLMIVTNSTANDATVVCDGAATGAAEATVTAGASRVIYCDATQVFGMSAEAVGGVATFLDLTDTPANYTSAASKLLRVNGAGNAVEFVTHKQAIQIAVSDETTALTTGTAKVTFRMPYAFTLTGVRASVTTAPTGADLKVDINVTGTGSILSTVITIEATEKSSVDATTQPVISSASLADDAEVTIDIDQIGSTIAGAGLKVTLIGRPT